MIVGILKITYVILVIASLIVIIKSNMNALMKLLWMLVVILIPVFGGLLFLAIRR
ncbi:PLD nuclease N-terminal domain-containing protein [Carboxylicivirga sp. RSCT41]|uniref:PLD nuclease N-terminal domain-containing protein n=1 Tax=Carboxylicivirga agarovorans TaxID=3417570 RepID=UPI003D33DD08